MGGGGGGSTKVKTPKPPKMQPPKPAPAPPEPEAKPVAKQVLKPEGSFADIRIGAAKKPSSSRNRTTQRGQGTQSLSIGPNQGMQL